MLLFRYFLRGLRVKPRGEHDVSEVRIPCYVIVTRPYTEGKKGGHVGCCFVPCVLYREQTRGYFDRPKNGTWDRGGVV